MVNQALGIGWDIQRQEDGPNDLSRTFQFYLSQLFLLVSLLTLP